ncbi:MAG: hypothetical protein ACLGIA_01975 [Actinomycetes bacterium]
MAWFAMVVAIAAALFGLSMLLPPAGKPPRWRRWLATRIQGVARRVGRESSPEADPFEALRLQTRLGILAEHIRMLEADQHVYAKAHRLLAARAAYDDLLDEACRLAGVPVDPQQHRTDSGRYQEELELASRGWSW